MNSPTKRSLDFLRKNGYLAGVVERWNPYAKVRQDLFGFCDIIAAHPKWGIIAVQTTTRAHQAERMNKILALPEAIVWLDCGGRIVVHGWAKVGARGKRKTWQVTETDVTIDFSVSEPPLTPVEPLLDSKT